MELPFKYIVLCIIRTLNERNMPLVIGKASLVNYFTKFMEKSYFTIEEKKEINDNFDFDYELDDLHSKYFQYFDIDGDEITFDSEYIEELGNLIIDEQDELYDMFLCDVDSVIEGDTEFLDIVGVKIKKDLYNYLLDIEKELEDCYDEMCRLDSFVGFAEVDLNPLMKKIKQLKMKKMIMLVNTNNLLSYFEHQDLMQYACNISDKTNDLEDIELLIEDDIFDSTDIMDDVLLRSIFTGSDSYIANLGESLVLNVLGIMEDKKYSIIKFYLTFLDLLEREIEHSNELLKEELIRIKYRLMNVMDSVYDTTLFINKEVIYDGEFKEDYKFANKTVYYFGREILMYDDERYRNKECDTENTTVYLDSIVKKLLIETYYKLTKDNRVIDMIKNNKLYGVNTISSNLLKDIVEKPKTKIKEV